MSRLVGNPGRTKRDNGKRTWSIRTLVKTTIASGFWLYGFIAGGQKAKAQPAPTYTWTSEQTGSWSDLNNQNWNGGNGVANSGTGGPLAGGGTGIVLQFNNVLGGGSYDASNDLGNFTLNALSLNSADNVNVTTVDGGQLNFKVNGGNAAQIYQGNVGDFQINSSIVLSSNLTVGGSGSGNVIVGSGAGDGDISGSGNLTKSGTFALILNGPLTYTGLTKITAGNVSFAATGDALTGGANITGGNAVYSGTSGSYGALAVSGSSSVQITGTSLTFGNVTSSGGNISVFGTSVSFANITLNANAANFYVDNAATGYSQGKLTITGGNYTNGLDNINFANFSLAPAGKNLASVSLTGMNVQVNGGTGTLSLAANSTFSVSGSALTVGNVTVIALSTLNFGATGSTAGNVKITGGTANFSSDTNQYGAANITGGLANITGSSNIFGDVTSSGGNLTVSGSSNTFGNLTSSGGAVTVSGPSATFGNITLKANASTFIVTNPAAGFTSGLVTVIGGNFTAAVDSFGSNLTLATTGANVAAVTLSGMGDMINGGGDLALTANSTFTLTGNTATVGNLMVVALSTLNFGGNFSTAANVTVTGGTANFTGGNNTFGAVLISGGVMNVGANTNTYGDVTSNGGNIVISGVNTTVGNINLNANSSSFIVTNAAVGFNSTGFLTVAGGNYTNGLDGINLTNFSLAPTGTNVAAITLTGNNDQVNGGADLALVANSTFNFLGRNPAVGNLSLVYLSNLNFGSSNSTLSASNVTLAGGTANFTGTNNQFGDFSVTDGNVTISGSATTVGNITLNTNASTFVVTNAAVGYGSTSLTVFGGNYTNGLDNFNFANFTVAPAGTNVAAITLTGNNVQVNGGAGLALVANTTYTFSGSNLTVGNLSVVSLSALNFGASNSPLSGSSVTLAGGTANFTGGNDKFGAAALTDGILTVSGSNVTFGNVTLNTNASTFLVASTAANFARGLLTMAGGNYTDNHNNFNFANFALAPAGSNNVSVSLGGTNVQINGVGALTLVANSTFNTSGSNLTVGSLTVVDQSTLNFGASNSINTNAGVTVTGGTANFTGGNDKFGTTTISGANTVFTVTGNTSTFGNTTVSSGTANFAGVSNTFGAVNVNGGSVVVASTGGNTTTGNVTASSGTFTVLAGSTLSAVGNFTVSGATVAINGNNSSLAVGNTITVSTGAFNFGAVGGGGGNVSVSGGTANFTGTTNTFGNATIGGGTANVSGNSITFANLTAGGGIFTVAGISDTFGNITENANAANITILPTATGFTRSNLTVVGGNYTDNRSNANFTNFTLAPTGTNVGAINLTGSNVQVSVGGAVILGANGTFNVSGGNTTIGNVTVPTLSTLNWGSSNGNSANATVTLSGGTANFTGGTDKFGNLTVSAGLANVSGNTNTFGNVTISGGLATVGGSSNTFGNLTSSGGNFVVAGPSTTLGNVSLATANAATVSILNGTTNFVRGNLTVNAGNYTDNRDSFNFTNFTLAPSGNLLGFINLSGNNVQVNGGTGNVALGANGTFTTTGSNTTIGNVTVVALSTLAFGSSNANNANSNITASGGFANFTGANETFGTIASTGGAVLVAGANNTFGNVTVANSAIASVSFANTAQSSTYGNVTINAGTFTDARDNKVVSNLSLFTLAPVGANIATLNFSGNNVSFFAGGSFTLSTGNATINLNGISNVTIGNITLAATSGVGNFGFGAGNSTNAGANITLTSAGGADNFNLTGSNNTFGILSISSASGGNQSAFLVGNNNTFANIAVTSTGTAGAILNVNGNNTTANVSLSGGTAGNTSQVLISGNNTNITGLSFANANGLLNVALSANNTILPTLSISGQQVLLLGNNTSTTGNITLNSGELRIANPTGGGGTAGLYKTVIFNGGTLDFNSVGGNSGTVFNDVIATNTNVLIRAGRADASAALANVAFGNLTLGNAAGTIVLTTDVNSPGGFTTTSYILAGNNLNLTSNATISTGSSVGAVYTATQFANVTANAPGTALTLSGSGLFWVTNNLGANATLVNSGGSGGGIQLDAPALATLPAGHILVANPNTQISVAGVSDPTLAVSLAALANGLAAGNGGNSVLGLFANQVALDVNLSGNTGAAFSNFGIGLQAFSGNATYTGNYTPANNSYILSGGNGTTTTSQTLTYHAQGVAGGNIAGTSSLLVLGNGTVVLDGNNTFSGGTTVANGGTLNITANKALGTGNITVTPTSGPFSGSAGTLTVSIGGVATISNNLILGGGSLNAGAPAGNAVTSNLTLAGTTFFTGSPTFGSANLTGSTGYVINVANAVLQATPTITLGAGAGTGNGTINFGNIGQTAPFGLTFAAAGGVFPTVNLNGVNTFTGPLSIGNAVVNVGAAGAFTAARSPNAVNLTTANAAFNLNGNNVVVGTLTNTGGNVADNAVGTAAVLTVLDAANANNTGIFKNGNTGVLSLQKLGAGVMGFNATNTFTGSVNVGNGDLALYGTGIAALPSITQVVVSGPAARLIAGDSVTATNNNGTNNRINSAVTLQLGGVGGAGQYLPALASNNTTGISQAFANLTLDVGADVVRFSGTNGLANQAAMTVSYGGLNRNVGGTGNLSIAQGLVQTLGNNALGNAIPVAGVAVIPAVTSNLQDFIINANGALTVYSAYTTPAATGTVLASGQVADFGNSTPTFKLGSGGTVDAIRLGNQNLSANVSIDLNGGNLVVRTGTILDSNRGTGAFGYTISNGTLALSTGAKDYVFIDDRTNAPGSSALVVSANLPNAIGGAAAGLTKAGAGLLALTNVNNSYTGPTFITGGGVLQIGVGGNISNGGANSSIGASTNVAGNLVFSNGTLQYVANTAGSTDRLFTVTAEGGTIDVSTIGTANTVSFTNAGTLGMTGLANRTLTLQGNSTGTFNTFTPIVGDSNVAVGFVYGTTALSLTGSTTWYLKGVNTYTGGTTVSGGAVVDIDADSAFGNAGGVVTFAGPGTIQSHSNNILYPATRTYAVGTQLATFDTNGNNATFSGNLTGTAGTFFKAGNGTLLFTNPTTGLGSLSLTVGQGTFDANAQFVQLANSATLSLTNSVIANGILSNYTGLSVVNLVLGTINANVAIPLANITGNLTPLANMVVTIGNGTGTVLLGNGTNGGINANNALGILDVSNVASSNLTVNVANLNFGASGATNPAFGFLKLPQAANGNSTVVTAANQIQLGVGGNVGEGSPKIFSIGNAAYVTAGNVFDLGTGGNVAIRTNNLIIGGSKAPGTIVWDNQATGGTLTLGNATGTGPLTVNLGLLNVASGSVQPALMDLTGGNVTANIATLSLGNFAVAAGANAGGGYGTLIVDGANSSVTVANVILGNTLGNTPANTYGALQILNGNVTVSGAITAQAGGGNLFGNIANAILGLQAPNQILVKGGVLTANQGISQVGNATGAGNTVILVSGGILNLSNGGIGLANGTANLTVSSSGVVNVFNNALALTTFAIGGGAVNNPANVAVPLLTQTGGTITRSNAAPFSLTGSYVMSGGVFSPLANATVANTTLSGTGALTVNANTTYTSNATLTQSGGAFTVNSLGTAATPGLANFTGGNTSVFGTVTAGALGNVSGSGNVTVGSGGNLTAAGGLNLSATVSVLTGGLATTPAAVTISGGNASVSGTLFGGSGGITQSGGNAIINAGGLANTTSNTTFSGGTTTILGNSTTTVLLYVTGASNVTVASTGNVTAGNFTQDNGLLSLASGGSASSGGKANIGGGTTSIAGTLSAATTVTQSAGAVTVSPTGLLTTAGAASLTGGTMIVFGQLTATGGTNINGGTVSGTGTINGPLTLTSGTLTAGAGPTGVGTLTATHASGVTFTGGAFNVDLSAGNAAGAFGQLSVPNGNVNLGTATTLSAVAYNGAVDKVFNIISTSNSVSGQFTGLGEGATVFIDSSTTTSYHIFYGDYPGVSGVVIAAAVPEPMSIMWLGGAGLGVAGWVRRRRAKCTSD